MIETTYSLKPLLVIICPLLASIMILLSGKKPNLRETWTIIASILQFLLILSMVPLIRGGGFIEYYLIMDILPHVNFGFKVDAFGLIFGLTASFLWIIVSIYSIGYMRTLNEHAQTRYYFCFALAILGAIGVALSGNLVTLFIFYEILTVSTYPLVAHEESPEALSAGRKYLAYLLTSGVFLLAAITLIYSLVGTTNFTSGGILKSSFLPKSSLITLFILFILGSIKAAYMPLHSWLPSAMIAPTPVSALLHAVAVVKAGVFIIVRIVCYIYGIDLMKELGLGSILTSFAAITMIVASLFAIAQDNLKRRLAYSTISQLAYIIFGVALLSPMGIRGAMIHIPFHGFMKITLFLCAGSILAISGKHNISELGGIGRKMPITMLAFMIGALGMCSLPPTCGFLSKWFLALGTIEANKPLFLVLLLISSLLDAIYFLPILFTAFFSKEDMIGENLQVDQKIKEAPLTMIIPISITAIFSILLTFPNPITNLIIHLSQLALTH